MKNKKTLDRAIKLLGADGYKEGNDWNGMKVYIPIYSKKACVGLPLVILYDGKELRLSTADEALEYINENN